MNRSTPFLIGLFIMLLNCSGVRGQGCSATLVPHFSVYTSVARDGKNIHTSVTMQGYTQIAPNSGCPMNTATHHAGSENKLNNVDHWSYSGSGCPTCYFSVTDNEQIVGVPGVSYPWAWEGTAICSIVGTFLGAGLGSGSIPGCLVPSSETTTDKGFNGGSYREQFDMTVSDSAQDNFDGYYVKEVTAVPGTNSCYWSGSGLP